MGSAVVAAGRRPATVRITVCVLLLLGFSAIPGVVALTGGTATAPPADWLDRIPLIDSWVIPGRWEQP